MKEKKSEPESEEKSGWVCVEGEREVEEKHQDRRKSRILGHSVLLTPHSKIFDPFLSLFLAISNLCFN